MRVGWGEDEGLGEWVEGCWGVGLLSALAQHDMEITVGLFRNMTAGPPQPERILSPQMELEDACFGSFVEAMTCVC